MRRASRGSSPLRTASLTLVTLMLVWGTACHAGGPTDGAATPRPRAQAAERTRPGAAEIACVMRFLRERAESYPVSGERREELVRMLAGRLGLPCDGDEERTPSMRPSVPQLLARIDEMIKTKCRLMGLGEEGRVSAWKAMAALLGIDLDAAALTAALDGDPGTEAATETEKLRKALSSMNESGLDVLLGAI